MCSRTLTLVTVCVCVGVFASAIGARRAKIDLKTFRPSTDNHIIYPRTGRLFHSDFVRDNQIFQSLERTNFMRRGPFEKTIALKRPKREELEETAQKKHVYVESGRIPGIEAKKSVLTREKDILLKGSLEKISNAPVKVAQGDKRIKREVDDKESKDEDNEVFNKQINDKESTETKLKSVSAADDIPKPVDIKRADMTNVNNEEDEFKPENKVEEDNAPNVKNNDTDKTLFVHDSKEDVQIPKTIELPVIGGEETGMMRKTVVTDDMKLYPVYRGVNYHYPLTERRLLYSPQLTVQMDLPVVSETIPLTENNTNEDSEEQGRSRRPLKKLAFPLLLALKLKTAIMLPLILGLISLIAFKGLWSGLTALGIAAALGLKALVGGSTKVLVQGPHLPPPHFHHFPPHEITEYWSRRGDDYNDYRPNSWT